MKDTQVFFKGPMVLAILNGQKTMTRRPVALPDDAEHVQYWAPPSGRSQSGWADPGVNYWTPSGNHIDPCPYGQLGDRLWVRETWQHSYFPYGPASPSADIFYRADFLDDPLGPDLEYSRDGIRRTWKPSIHMPRWASRIDLEIIAIRVERLQNISDADLAAEGIAVPDQPGLARFDFRAMWDEMYGRGSWDINPWVWVIEFKRIEKAPS